MKWKRHITVLARNIFATWKVPAISPHESNGYTYRGFLRPDTGSLIQLLENLNEGNACTRRRVQLYHAIGKKLIWITETNVDGKKRVVGANIYYFNERDIREGTVHEGFIGVLPEWSGQGIATKMRSLAHEHFRSVGILGVSSRISTSNSASLKSAEKLGFGTIEEYQDKTTGEKRRYMIRVFKESTGEK